MELETIIKKAIENATPGGFLGIGYIEKTIKKLKENNILAKSPQELKCLVVTTCETCPTCTVTEKSNYMIVIITDIKNEDHLCVWKILSCFDDEWVGSMSLTKFREVMV